MVQLPPVASRDWEASSWPLAVWLKVPTFSVRRPACRRLLLAQLVALRVKAPLLTRLPPAWMAVAVATWNVPLPTCSSLPLAFCSPATFRSRSTLAVSNMPPRLSRPACVTIRVCPPLPRARSAPWRLSRLAAASCNPVSLSIRPS
ncbi:hypothetical protein D3C77_604710 [compost metagenome]